MINPKFKNSKKFFVVLSLICIGCSPTIFKPTLADVESGKSYYSNLTLEQLNQGYLLYSNKCGSCHSLYKPKKISKERWARALPDMKIEAKLSNEQYDLISRYLKAKIENPL